MRLMGVWERDEGLAEELERELAGRDDRPLLRRGRHPAELAGAGLDLLVVSPRAAGLAGAGSISCRLLLLPGCAGALVRGMRVEEAVSYGTSPRDTITLSSLEQGRISLAVQRELVTVEGGVVERQELVLPFPQGVSPELFMAKAGALLLLRGTAEHMT